MTMFRMVLTAVLLALLLVVALSSPSAVAQTPPSASQIVDYDGLLAAAHNNDVVATRTLLSAGADPRQRDGSGRTPVHVAAFSGSYEVLRALVVGGADIKAKEYDRYDVITIAAVDNDKRMMELAIELGGDPRAMTSPYDGTALIAAAHLGHVDVVKALIAAGAPLDHVNNLGWTALIEAVG